MTEYHVLNLISLISLISLNHQLHQFYFNSIFNSIAIILHALPTSSIRSSHNVPQQYNGLSHMVPMLIAPMA